MLKDGSICSSLCCCLQMLEEKACTEEGRRISDSATETNMNKKSFQDIAFFIASKEDCLQVTLLLLCCCEFSRVRYRTGKPLVLLWQPHGASNDEALQWASPVNVHLNTFE